MTKPAETIEFGREMEREREVRLRRRFLWYTGTMFVLSIGAMAVFLLLIILTWSSWESAEHADLLITGGVGVLGLLLYALAFVYVWKRPVIAGGMYSIAYWLVVGSGVLVIGSDILSAELAPALGGPRPTGRELALWSALFVFLTHFPACVFLPWTPWESFKPAAPLLVIYALVAAIYLRGAPALGVVTIALAPLMVLPGVLICFARHSRFREQMTLSLLRGRYFDLRRELTDARRIHESLFPQPLTSGQVRFTYRYQPMRLIGGDFLYARPGAGFAHGRGGFSLVILDVTGHGIPAALTVNRLYGELERLFAEDPDTPPGEVLRALNRYVHLTLAGHSVYASAFCLRVDLDTGELHYASGGHPPAFLCSVDGRIHQLESTSFVLGACAASDFEPDPAVLPFGPGDTLVAYTDGAIESRNGLGRMLGVTGLQRVLVAATIQGANLTGYTSAIMAAVERHRDGPPADDTLIVELSRPLDTGPRERSARELLGVSGADAR